MHSHIKIGKSVATFGIGGEVIVTHNLGKKTVFKNIEVLFVEQTKNALIPFFIKTAKAKTDDETYVLFEDIKSKEAAKMLVGKPIWLLQNDFKKQVEKKSPIALLGYTVYDNDELIGVVNEVIEQPHQILLTVMYKDKEAYLPMHEESIISIDHKKNTIILNLPDGLMEIYI